ncbi:relaxase [Nakamurella sp. YIM 132087]|uniref:Relaxase n=1 Tax=Nakamurella alba TaxID=2665158 RepID=A0A7K1FMN6_9ACTN|nr:relaxase [Nakamurella alba]MTD15431.1 relaxase [Nakamurella alba]
MIPKVTRGNDFHGLLQYLVGPGRANEHRDPHIVAADAVIQAYGPAGILDRRDAKALADELALPSLVTGRAPGRGVVWQCSLSIKAGDPPLTDEQWGAIAAGFIRKMGWTSDDLGEPGVPWLAIHHGTSKAGNDHIHLVVSAVRDDGSFINTFHDFTKAQQACRALEVEHGLRRLQSATLGVGSRGLTYAELQLQERTGREPSRRILERYVRAAATMAMTEAEFVQHLRAEGVRVAPYYAAGGTSAVVGYKVALAGEGERFFGGGHLAKDLTLPRLRSRWGDSPDATAQAVAVWRGTPPTVGHPQRPADLQMVVHRAVTELRSMNQRQRTVPLGDVRGWADAAGELAGVLAAWSLAADWDDRDPIVETIAVLSNLAQLRAPRRRGHGGRRPFSPHAAIAARSLPSAGRPDLIVELLGVLRLVGRAAKDCGQPRVAAQIHDFAGRSGDMSRRSETVGGSAASLSSAFERRYRSLQPRSDSERG